MEGFNMTINTIGQLIRKIMADYPEEIAEYLRGDDAFVEIMPQECIDLIREHTNLFRLSHEEAKTLMNVNYGSYSYCNTKDEVKYNLLLDYVEYKIVDYTKYRSINSFKKAQLEESR